MKIRLDLADRLFSKYIRRRDGWKCQRCYRQHEENSSGLHNSHYFGRSKESTRFDPENCDALCFGCHQLWGSTDREAYRTFKINQLGQTNFDLLALRANTYQKRDRKLSLLYAKELMKDLDKSE